MSIPFFRSEVVSSPKRECQNNDTRSTSSLLAAARPVTARSDRRSKLPLPCRPRAFRTKIRSVPARPGRRRMPLTHLCNRSVVNEHPELRLRPRPPKGTTRPRRRPFPQLSRAGFGAIARSRGAAGSKSDEPRVVWLIGVPHQPRLTPSVLPCGSTSFRGEPARTSVRRRDGRRTRPRTPPVAALHRENPVPPRPLRTGWRANALPALRDRSAFHRRVPHARRARLDRAFGPPPIPCPFGRGSASDAGSPLFRGARSPTLLPVFGAERERPRAARRFLPYVNELEARPQSPRELEPRTSKLVRCRDGHRLATTTSWTPQPRR